jgi:hypothetical protein
VTVELKSEFPLPGLKLTVTPDGTFSALSSTVWLYPWRKETVRVMVVELSCLTEALLGLTEREKSGWGGAVTVRVKVTVWVFPSPPVPFRVRE